LATASQVFGHQNGHPCETQILENTRILAQAHEKSQLAIKSQIGLSGGGGN
jgi:hypothetical protein